jgi:serine/threonine protein kinase
VEEFEITGLVGEGGFGVVYRALDHSLERRVAVKEYLPWMLASRLEGSTTVSVRTKQDSETFGLGLSSFINEARLLARFDHPALLKVHRFWEGNGTAYMAMPLYEGPTLKQALAERAAPPDEAWLRAIIDPLLDALSVLHNAHCYHRDISPDNILLTATGPVLLDFGAARRVINDASQMLTVILKEGYAPIEQYGTSAATRQGPWTDIYALCAMVRYAITAQKPVSAVDRSLHDPLEPLEQIAYGRYSPSFLAAIDAGMAIRPEQRPQNVVEFRSQMNRPRKVEERLDTDGATRLRPSPVRPPAAERLEGSQGSQGSRPSAQQAAGARSSARIPRWVAALAGCAALVALGAGALVEFGRHRAAPIEERTPAGPDQAASAATASPQDPATAQALAAAHSSLAKLLASARSTVAANGGTPDIVLAEAEAAAQRVAAAEAAGHLDEALVKSTNAMALTKSAMRGFLESLVGSYARIAQEKMNENDLVVAEMAIKKGKELKRMESEFD